MRKIWVFADFRALHTAQYFHMDTISASNTFAKAEGTVTAWRLQHAILPVASTAFQSCLGIHSLSTRF